MAEYNKIKKLAPVKQGENGPDKSRVPIVGLSGTVSNQLGISGWRLIVTIKNSLFGLIIRF